MNADVQRHCGWRDFVAGRLEFGCNWTRRRVAFALWRRGYEEGCENRPCGVFESYFDTYRQAAGQLVARLQLEDRVIEIISTREGVSVLRDGTILGSVERVRRWWFTRRRWNVIDGGGAPCCTIGTAGYGMLWVNSPERPQPESRAMTVAVRPTKVALRPENYYSHYRGRVPDDLFQQRFIKPTFMEGLMQRAMGDFARIMADDVAGLFRWVPEREVPPLFEGDHTLFAGREDLGVAAALWCSAWNVG